MCCESYEPRPEDTVGSAPSAEVTLMRMGIQQKEDVITLRSVRFVVHPLATICAKRKLKLLRVR